MHKVSSSKKELPLKNAIEKGGNNALSVKLSRRWTANVTNIFRSSDTEFLFV